MGCDKFSKRHLLTKDDQLEIYKAFISNMRLSAYVFELAHSVQ